MSSLQTLPDSETIRRTVQEVIQRPEYQLGPRSDDGGAFRDLFLRVLYWLLTPFLWLFEAMEGLPDVLRWLIVIGLVVLLVLLIAHIGYTLVSSIRTKGRSSEFKLSDARGPDPKALEQLAQEAVAQGDFISAVRYLFRACLVRLQENDERTFRPGMTNREYLRRFRTTSFVDSLALFVELIDTRWYGGGECRREDYESCRTAYALIQQQMKDLSHAHGA